MSSSANRRELDAAIPDNINTELALWKQLIFHSDMAPPSPPKENAQNSDPSRSQIPSPYFQAPHTAPPQHPPETYTYLIQALLSLQGSAYPPTFPHPTPPWPSSSAPLASAPPVAGPSSFYSTNPPIPLPQLIAPQAQDPSSSQLAPLPIVSPTTVSTAQDPDGNEDATSTTEDKRRRNTAASARFRIKKKQKTLNLERTVTDLTGRAEELDREANDLRRENTWLKEIILLKGRNLATSGSQVPASEYERIEEEARTHSGPETESTAKRGGKGKGKES